MRRVLMVLCILCGFGTSCNIQARQNITSSLEANLATPLRWEDGCLRGSLNISNRSTGPLFLTVMGPYYDIALDVSKDESHGGGPVAWVNIAGASDLVLIAVKSLDAGSSTQRDFCLRPSVWVVNLRLKTRREIPVRGKMRISVSYFATEDDFESYKESRNKAAQPKDSQLWSETYAEIPCPSNTCKADCTHSPIGVHGEGRLVPDGGGPPDWNIRGEQLTSDLARKVPPCGKDHSVQKP